MTIRVALHHRTAYRYSRAVNVGPQVVRLRPAYHSRTPIEAYDLHVSPADHFHNRQQDPFANPMDRYVFEKPIDHFEITVDLIANMTVINPFDFFITEYADQYPFEYPAQLRRQLNPYLDREPGSGIGSDPHFVDWVASLPRKSERLVDYLVEINRRTQQRVDYTIRMEPGVQTPGETLQKSRGSCRDSAWLLVHTFRALGIAARFTSGYLIQLAADIPPVEGPAGPTDDFCDLHAWTEVYVPGAGWVGLDPTSGLFAGEGHIPLAGTPSFEDAAPVTGSLEECEVSFEHEMKVVRHHEDPRVTLPYDDATWNTILRTGDGIDHRLQQSDVRLTMGGEPTFVSIDNMDDPQWTTDAVGPEKRVRSNQLLLEMRRRFAPGGLLHYGQGKWYPGESLPRWALGCFWRRDGQAIWQDDQWIADEGADDGYTVKHAQRFLGTLSRELGISAKLTFPVYEDTFHYLWRENRLPIDVDPSDPKLDDPNERAMMIRTFQNGLTKPVGYVLPIRRAWWQARGATQTRSGWQGGRWPIRGDYVFLLPGDSPIGLRLPLETLPVAGAASAAILNQPLDPSFSRGPLPVPLPLGQSARRVGDESAPDRHGSPRQRMVVDGSLDGGTETVDGKGYRINPQVLSDEDEFVLDDDLPGGEDLVRTALCVECRHGRLHVFMPPTQRLEDYLELVNAIEHTCRTTGYRVLIEGYPPPADPRLDSFKVTPDPGVIEVNMHPASSWRDLVGTIESMYDAARHVRLGTDKFDLDGRHTGTGGGNHIVLGAATPLDSPFLRRPQLLASMVAFWNNHPSLSYLFSSKFVGPTSQAPRADESRRDAAEELRIAMTQVWKSVGNDAGIAPWLVDRLFRDLLTDLTGNTHRAEICIDKLYSPDSSTGRLGLLELRGFEMPPHPRMSLVTGLLVRGIVAAFWDQPYRESVIDWRERLHDRFFLSTPVRDDFAAVLRDLAIRDVRLEPAWFDPQFEFRFPLIGTVTHQDVTLTLRDAIEPWYVMGEEPGGGGTVRYVDSSLERLELIVQTDRLDDFQVLCNGVTVPLHATGDPYTAVAGVRFRAWQPPRCLHPTIGIHSPLRFEIIRLASGQSIGGCTYHVVHPGGRGTERSPINANEAESRRAARFEIDGLSGGVQNGIQPPVENRGVSPRYTLDMRAFG
ncbi:MAG: transglutaminase family protein [Planctomycetota bacterium]